MTFVKLLLKNVHAIFLKGIYTAEHIKCIPGRLYPHSYVMGVITGTNTRTAKKETLKPVQTRRDLPTGYYIYDRQG